MPRRKIHRAVTPPLFVRAPLVDLHFNVGLMCC